MLLLLPLILCSFICSTHSRDQLNSYEADKFLLHLKQAVETVRDMFQSNRIFCFPKDVPHTYENKIELGEFLSSSAIVSLADSFHWLGLTEENLIKSSTWAESQEVFLIVKTEELLEYLGNETYQVESPSQTVQTEVGSMLGTFSISTKTKTLTSITKHKHRFHSKMSIHLQRGLGQCPVGLCPDDDKELWSMHLMNASAKYDFIQDAAIYYPTTMLEEKLRISWLIKQIGKPFSIDSKAADYRTPTRNSEVNAALKQAKAISDWAGKILAAKEAIHPRPNWLDPASTGKEIFIPILPIFEVFESQNSSSEVDSNGSDSGRSNTEGEIAARRLLANLLDEHRRQLHDHCSKLTEQDEKDDGSGSDHDLPLAVPLLVLKHLRRLTSFYVQSVSLLEDLLVQQVAAALGKHINEEDLAAYMSFHDRSFLLPPYQPQPVSFSVRRSSSHSPEGAIRVEVSYGNGEDSSYHTLRALTLKHSSSSSLLSSSTQRDNSSEVAVDSRTGSLMTIPLSASTSISFAGDRFVHSLLTHRFSDGSRGIRGGSEARPSSPGALASAGPRLRLVASARQFSSFILLLGTLTSPTEFHPVQAVIVKNRSAC